MKKLLILILVIVVMLAIAASAFASMKTVEFEGKGMGKVTFDGQAHKAKGLTCKDCHPALFHMKKGGDVITMKDINEGKFCGACHNGAKSFSAKDAANCNKCHKK
jgi:c(7)-type cytochrome triheme protein